MKWQSTKMDCDACGYEWAAVHPVIAEYLECPVCHHMTPAPYVEEKTMELDIINRLYLELSRVATATTAKELKLQKGIGDARQTAMELCWQIEKSGASEELTKCSVMASELQSKLNDLLP